MIYLNVPFQEKDQAKSLGARWDAMAKKWYIPDNLTDQEEKFARWSENPNFANTAADNLSQPPHSTHHEIQSSNNPSTALNFSASPEQAVKSIPENFQATNVFDDYQPYLEPSQQTATEKGQALSRFLKRIQQTLRQNFAGGHWVVAEISSIQDSRGNLYLELSENDPQTGQMKAKIRAQIWKNQAGFLTQKFVSETGMNLEIGQKVLVLCEVQFHEQYGLSLVIQDIDGSFSLGELEQKVQQIRKKLISENLLEQNKHQFLAQDFYRIAVIAPPNAAGLGDFQADAEKLQTLNLCHFDYYNSSFQGNAVERDFQQAFQAVLQTHQQNPYEALVIIRGGGAKLDLHQLNEYSIARQIALMPIPILSGIGHERDSTILDEVAHSRFDTPSKVIHYIWQSIQSQALHAKQNWQQIIQMGKNQSYQAEKSLQQLWQQIQQQSHNRLHYWQQATQRPLQLAQQQAQHKLLQQKQNLNWLNEQIKQTAPKVFLNQKHKIQQGWQTIERASLQKIYYWRSASHQEFDTIKQAASQKNWQDKQDLEQVAAEIKQTIKHQLAVKKNAIAQLDDTVKKQALMQTQTQRKELKNRIALILNAGPKVQMKRGFAVVKNKDNQTITSKQQAQNQDTLNVEFHDGEVTVTVNS